ncbi:MAG: LytTR family DNA-binding domain-containing protein [Gemmatimonadaceae bacterium]
MSAIRVLIADDEAPARMRLEDLLQKEADVTLVGMATSGDDAVAKIRELAPDIVFLDVQMPGMTGLEVVEEIGASAMPATIFCTAYDQYAIRAFDVAAVDYLLKPYDDERFEEAFNRARRRLALEGVERLRGQLMSMLERVPVAPPVIPVAPAHYLERIAVEVKGKVRPVPVAEIDYITSDGPYAELHVAGRKMVIRESMQALEERLDPSKFMRVHRSVIVRLDLVEMLHRAAGGEYELQLKGGGRLRVSRSRREALERWLGVV